MTVRAVIYARTSMDCPLSAEQQIESLTAVAAERAWTVVQQFIDRPTSVRKAADRRPGEAALLNAIRDGSVDRVLIWSIDRIGRSLIELVTFLEACRAAGVSMWIEREKLDTVTSNGLSLLDVGEMLAQHVRQGRRDRILRGQAAARSLDIRFGRPPLPNAKVEKARVHLLAGKGVRQAARMAGISAASVSRLKNDMRAANSAT